MEVSMFKHKINLVRFIPKEQSEVFRYFTEPALLEQWCYPDGMSLNIPLYEAKQNGRYHWIHSNAEGNWEATGYLMEFIPDEKLVMIDTIKNPQGKIIMQDVKCSIELQSMLGGTDIIINHSGFPDKTSADECRESWNQCIDRLVTLTVSDANQSDNIQREITDY